MNIPHYFCGAQQKEEAGQNELAFLTFHQVYIQYLASHGSDINRWIAFCSKSTRAHVYLDSLHPFLLRNCLNLVLELIQLQDVLRHPECVRDITLQEAIQPVTAARSCCRKEERSKSDRRDVVDLL